jgi:hypothetical protein
MPAFHADRILEMNRVATSLAREDLHSGCPLIGDRNRERRAIRKSACATVFVGRGSRNIFVVGSGDRRALGNFRPARVLIQRLAECTRVSRAGQFFVIAVRAFSSEVDAGSREENA